MQTLRIMYGGKLTGLTLPDYMLSEDLGMEEARERIVRETSEFLLVNPNVKDLLDDNMAAIDTGLGDTDLVEHVFTFLVMAGERFYAEQTLERAVGDLSPELFT